MQEPAQDGIRPIGRPAHQFIDEAREIVGERFAEARFDPDRAVRITVIELIELIEQDRSALTAAAERLGIADRVRLECADPEHLRKWESLKWDLLRLDTDQPGGSDGRPSLEGGYERPPVGIHLSADAESVAADLHENYGGFVRLQVGALYFPERTCVYHSPAIDESRIPADPALLHVEPVHPMT